MGSSVGQPSQRIDVPVKATGQAIYAVDMTMPGMLHGRYLGSPYPHALIRRIDTTKASSLCGVKAVVTGKDFPFLHGECIINIPFLAIDKVRYVGEPVVAVAAETRDIAEEALSKIEIDYEPLEPVFDPEEAMKPEAPLIHESLEQYQTISAVKTVPGTNICQHFVFTMGDTDRGFDESDYIFEDRFTTQQTQHGAIEPHACIALVDSTGRITVWGQNDSPHRARKEIAQALGIPQAKVRICTGYVGGNFGGKGGLKSEAIAIALAHKVRGRPVKVVFTREEVFRTLTRTACITYIKTGVKRNGKIVARHVRLIWDMGAYAEKGPTVSLHAGSLATGPYDIPNVKIESYSVFTNKPVAGATRGYGLPQVCFAYESQMDIIAEKLGMDPVDLRLKNLIEEGTKVVTGQRLYSVGLKQCLEKIREEMKSPAPVPSHLRDITRYGKWARGRGIACCYKSVKTPTVSAAYVKIDEDGSTSVLTSTVEVGQGSHTILAQIAAEVLGLEEKAITVSFADTDVTPYDTSTTSGRSTFHMGNAVRIAAEDAKQQLLSIASPLLGASAKDLRIQDGNVIAPDGRSLSVAQILRTVFGAGAGAAILGRGVYSPQDILGLEELGTRSLEAFSTLSVYHMYAAQGAEVMVDLDTGEVRIIRLVAAHDVGRAINPLNCKQQIEGAMGMGSGFALTEEYLWDNGRILTDDFLNYGIPTALDSSPMEVHLIEVPHPQGPFGAKGAGEMAIAPTAPAIANAVRNACGARIFDLPLKPTRILRQLASKRSSEKL